VFFSYVQLIAGTFSGAPLPLPSEVFTGTSLPFVYEFVIICDDSQACQGLKTTNDHGSVLRLHCRAAKA